MKRPIKYGIIGIAALGLALAGIKAYNMYRTYGLGIVYLDESGDAIPGTTATPPPLTPGSADWPCWRGASLDGKSTLEGIQKDWEKGLPLMWEVNYLCQGEESVAWSGPVVQGNRVVVTGRDKSHDLVFCLHAETGKLIWQTKYESPADGKFGTGPRSTPAIDGEYVYTYGRSGDLACWSLFDGTLVWKKNVMNEGGQVPEWGFSSSPLVFEGMVIVSGGGEARLIAVDKLSGETAWRTPGGEAGYASVIPVQLPGKTGLLHFHGTGLACIKAEDGQVLWDMPWETDYFVNAVTPIITGDTVFITSGYKTGGRAIKITEEGYTILWTNKEIASQLSDQILIDGYLYGYTAEGNNNSPFKCVRLSTGEAMWNTKSLGGGACILVDGHLICLDVKGNLYLVKPHPGGLELAGEFRHAIPKVKQQSWTAPVVANGKLYLRYMQKLICYDLMP